MCIPHRTPFKGGGQEVWGGRSNFCFAVGPNRSLGGRVLVLRRSESNLGSGRVAKSGKKVSSFEQSFYGKFGGK